MRIIYIGKRARSLMELNENIPIDYFLNQLSEFTEENPSFMSDMFIEPSNPNEAAGLLKAFKDSVLSENLPHPLVLRWMAKSFDKFMAGNITDATSLKKALGLSYGRRARPIKNKQRDLEITHKVIDQMAAGTTLLEAALSLSQEYNIHESNIQKIYSKYKKIIKISEYFDLEEDSDLDIPPF